MDSQRLKAIFSLVNNQISSGLSISNQSSLHLHFTKNKVIGQINSVFPAQKINNFHTLTSHFAHLYFQFRNAYEANDTAKMHRFLTGSLYNKWRKQNLELKIYPIVYNIELVNCGILKNEMGKWAQFVVDMSHKDGGRILKRRHCIERKLIVCEGSKRKWYFCQFDN